ncbi:MAG TPA: hypothetical protein DCZ01_00820 [Elusimicrobia bacterium]|nr:MAG: hypothetical protein A2X37_03920 [Elusimicrobia bacterium GWA2_66_18]HAZ07074.1 hypothetical protein [Elusimicrobiota bacterium]
MRPRRRRSARPTTILSKGPAPRAAAARRTPAVGGRGPTNQALPPEKRRSAVPGGRDRNATLTGGGWKKRRLPSQTRRAAAVSAVALRRLGHDQSAPSARAYAAISNPVHGWSSTEEQGQAAARRQILSKRPSPAPVSQVAGPVAHGTMTSRPQSAKPAHIRSPARGTRATLVKGPTIEARPKVAAKSGQSAAAIAALTPARTTAAHAKRGQDRGAAASRRGEATSRAAQASTLMSAPGESAAKGLQARRIAAEAVSAAEAVVGRSRTRAAVPAANISQALTLGGSAPAMRA